MHARVVTGEFQPGRLDEFLELFKREFIPSLREERGFRNVSVLVDRDANKLVAFALYETEADIRASDPGFQERSSKAAHLLVGKPVAEVYEVGFQS